MFIGHDQVQVGNKQSLRILNIGSSMLYSSFKDLFLINILHVHEIKKNLISVHQFTKNDTAFFEIQPSFFYVKDPFLGDILLHGKSDNGLCPLHALLLVSTSPTTYVGERAFVVQ